MKSEDLCSVTSNTIITSFELAGVHHSQTWRSVRYIGTSMNTDLLPLWGEAENGGAGKLFANIPPK